MATPPDKTVLTHLYRGELSRMLAYRVRLDTTTNWAIGLSAAMVSFGLGHPEIPHSVLLLAIVLDLQLLWLEARRYRAFDLARRRVKLLESGFLAEVMGADVPGWSEELLVTYREPAWRISVTAAAAHRVRRNYVWLIASVVGVWLLKVHLHGRTDFASSAKIWMLPGPLVLLLLGTLMAGLVAVALRAPLEDPS